MFLLCVMQHVFLRLQHLSSRTVRRSFTGLASYLSYNIAACPPCSRCFPNLRRRLFIEEQGVRVEGDDVLGLKQAAVSIPPTLALLLLLLPPPSWLPLRLGQRDRGVGGETVNQ